ncbi:AbrB/MazE/SpoVT family DNA-binding domain-containing protein [Candidatus Bipolaricaulota sp. J31]
MNVVTVGRRFQVVIPKEIRESLRLRPGDKLEVRLEEGRIAMYLLPRKKGLVPLEEKISRSKPQQTA